MFGKKKKQPKVEKVFEGSSTEEQVSSAENLPGEDAVDEAKNKTSEDLNDMFGIQEEEEVVEDDGLTDAQREQFEKLNSVKSKISKILQSTNIEIVDENIGDEYETEQYSASAEKSQQDYDSLKSMFGARDKGRQELTLTIDEFDYTYVGQYLEEYDLMHIKSIKRVKLQRKYPKKLKKFLIAASVIVVVGLGVFLGLYLTRDIPVYLKAVTLSQTEHDYYVNDIFDYTGLYINLEYSDGNVKTIKLEEKYLKDITGKVEKVGENGNEIQFVSGTSANLIFNYEGFDVTYTVNIIKKKEVGISSLYNPGLFNVQKDEIISNNKLWLMIVYDNKDEEIFDYKSQNTSKIKIKIDGVECEYVKGQGYKASKDITTASTISIEYDKYVLNITYADGVSYATTVVSE